MSNENKVIMEERHLPENEGILGSKTTSMTSDGSIQKDIKFPFCDSCGQMLREEKLAVCSCKRKICQSCAIAHESKTYCRDCAKQITGITKEGFFILYGVAKEASLRDIKSASSIGSESLEISLEMLLERKLVEKKGLSIFASYRITHEGLALLATSEQIYCNEGDVLRFLTKLDESTTGD